MLSRYRLFRLSARINDFRRFVRNRTVDPQVLECAIVGKAAVSFVPLEHELPV
jgi:hypothetical protein